MAIQICNTALFRPQLIVVLVVLVASAMALPKSADRQISPKYAVVNLDERNIPLNGATANAKVYIGKTEKEIYELLGQPLSRYGLNSECYPCIVDENQLFLHLTFHDNRVQQAYFEQIFIITEGDSHYNGEYLQRKKKQK